MSDESTVLKANLLCPICRDFIEEIELSVTAFTKEGLELFNNSEHKIIDFMEEPCQKCQSKLDNDLVMLAEVDPTKSDINIKDDRVDTHSDNVYLTGRTCWVHKDIFKKVFRVDNPEAYQFAPIEVFNQLEKIVNTMTEIENEQ